jgi:hypothetical protein
MNDINDLKLPTIKEQRDLPLFPHKSLKIEDILNFMEFNLQHTIDIKAVRENKHKFYVFLPFQL